MADPEPGEVMVTSRLPAWGSGWLAASSVETKKAPRTADNAAAREIFDWLGRAFVLELTGPSPFEGRNHGRRRRRDPSSACRHERAEQYRRDGEKTPDPAGFPRARLRSAGPAPAGLTRPHSHPRFQPHDERTASDSVRLRRFRARALPDCPGGGAPAALAGNGDLGARGAPVHDARHALRHGRGLDPRLSGPYLRAGRRDHPDGSDRPSAIQRPR